MVKLIGKPFNTITTFIKSSLEGILTTKGDLLSFSTVPARLPVGTDTQVLTADSSQSLGLKWADASAGLTFARIIKSADETVNSTTTLQDDDELTTALSANKRYFFVLYLYFVSDATPDFKYLLTVPTGSNSRRIVSDWGAVFESSTTTPSISTSPLVSNSNQYTVSVHGYVITAGTAGNLTLQWAQNTSDAANTTVKAGSTLIVYEA